MQIRCAVEKKNEKTKETTPTIVSFSHWTNVLAGNNWNKNIPPTAANPNQNNVSSLVIFDLPRSVTLFAPFISFLFLILLIFRLLGTCGIIKNIQLTSDLIILNTQKVWDILISDLFSLGWNERLHIVFHFFVI